MREGREEEGMLENFIAFEDCRENVGNEPVSSPSI